MAEEREALRPLPASPLGLCREVRAPVSRFSTIQVLHNTYSVPSRLIGTTLLIRVHSETLEVYRATAPCARPEMALNTLTSLMLIVVDTRSGEVHCTANAAVTVSALALVRSAAV